MVLYLIIGIYNGIRRRDTAINSKISQICIVISKKIRKQLSFDDRNYIVIENVEIAMVMSNASSMVEKWIENKNIEYKFFKSNNLRAFHDIKADSCLTPDIASEITNSLPTSVNNKVVTNSQNSNDKVVTEIISLSKIPSEIIMEYNPISLAATKECEK